MNEDEEMVRKLNLRIVQAQSHIENYPDQNEGLCKACLSYYDLEQKDPEMCANCAVGKTYSWLDGLKSILNGGVGSKC